MRRRILAGLGGAVMSLINGMIAEGLIARVVLPFAILVGLIVGRMYFELVILFFHIADTLDEIRKNTAKG